MEIIRILPHHAIGFFRVFYLGCEPEKMLSWYDDEGMRQNGVSVIKKVVNNPNQLIQIASSYDSVCSSCPRNKRGRNLDNNSETACNTYDSYNPDTEFAKTLGLEEVMNSAEPITAQRFFELMKPTFDRYNHESPLDEFGKKKSLRQLFGEPAPVYSNVLLYQLPSKNELLR